MDNELQIEMLRRELLGIELEMDVLRNRHNPTPNKREAIADLERERATLVQELDRISPYE